MTIKSLREKKGLSIVGLGREIGVSRQSIYNIETGRYMPRYDVASALAKTLGVSIEKIYKICEAQAAQFKEGK